MIKCSTLYYYIAKTNDANLKNINENSLNLLNDTGAFFSNDWFFRHRNGTILERVVRLPKQKLAIVLETLVQCAHNDDRQHRSEQTADTVNAPLVDKDHLGVAEMELCAQN